MSEPRLVRCTLCFGTGKVEAPTKAFPGAEYSKSDVVIAVDGIPVIPMECPICFGHGVREEADHA